MRSIVLSNELEKSYSAFAGEVRLVNYLRIDQHAAPFTKHR